MIKISDTELIEEVTPTRQLAKELVADYRRRHPKRLTQAMIDGDGRNRPLSLAFHRAVRFHHASLWRRLRNLF